ncbi:MAG TPA: TRAP transporter substrate-binding protein [Tepidimicrobium sp.]|nr:TRAP transporter substrate-binding protein [Tepidimicrobium sp.]
MRKILVILLALTLIAGLLVGCQQDAAPAGDTEEPAGEDAATDLEPLHLVIAHNQTSTDNPYQYGMVKFKEVVEEISDGNITVEVHNGSIGTNESELIEKLSLGAADMVVASPGFMTGIGVEEVDLLSLLYLFDGFDHWEKAMDGDFGNTMAEIISEKTNNEFKIMSYWSAGVRNYYGKKPIEVPEDASGLSIRTQNSVVQQQFWKDAGAIPASVDWNELYQALQQGVVDASENDYTNFSQQDHHKTVNGKYISETEHDYTTRLLLMNGERFDSLPKQQQDWIIEAVKQATQEEREVTYRMLDESKAKVIEEGGEVNEVDKEAFMKIAIPIQDNFAKENDLVDLLEMVRSAK